MHTIVLMLRSVRCQLHVSKLCGANSLAIQDLQLSPQVNKLVRVKKKWECCQQQIQNAVDSNKLC